MTFHTFPLQLCATDPVNDEVGYSCLNTYLERYIATENKKGQTLQIRHVLHTADSLVGLEIALLITQEM